MRAMSRWVGPLSLFGVLIAPPAFGVPYDAGSLEFRSEGQSMWGTGSAFRKAESVFVGSQWRNKTATIGDILGSEGSDAYWTREWVPIPWFECHGSWCSGGHWHDGWWQDIWVPPTPDTRTGAQVDVTSSGKVGLEFGYSIDSGSVDSRLNYAALADLPTRVRPSQYFNLNPGSSLDDGSLETQSPNMEAYISAIMELSGSVDSKACALGNCAAGSFDLPTVDLDQRILSVDPNSLKILDGVLPGDKPLAQLPIANQSVTLEGGAAVTPAGPVVGFKLSGPYGVTLVNTMPPTPSVTVDLAEIEAQVPNIGTTGGKADGQQKLVSSGRDDFITATLDLDGAATLMGGLPPAGLNFTLIDAAGIKLGASVDLIDVDAGPVLGVTQDFELVPTLMVDLAFSNPVQIDGESGLHSSWQGEWDQLPEFAISETTVFSPTFWIDAMLRNEFGIDLGLVGLMDVLKFGATGSAGGIDLLKFGPLSLNDLLGLDNKLFETSKMKFGVYDDMFALEGFNRVAGTPFTISVVSVAEPALLSLLLIGLAGLARGRAVSDGWGLHARAA